MRPRPYLRLRAGLPLSLPLSLSRSLSLSLSLSLSPHSRPGLARLHGACRGLSAVTRLTPGRQDRGIHTHTHTTHTHTHTHTHARTHAHSHTSTTAATACRCCLLYAPLSCGTSISATLKLKEYTSASWAHSVEASRHAGSIRSSAGKMRKWGGRERERERERGREREREGGGREKLESAYIRSGDEQYTILYVLYRRGGQMADWWSRGSMDKICMSMDWPADLFPDSSPSSAQSTPPPPRWPSSTDWIWPFGERRGREKIRFFSVHSPILALFNIFQKCGFNRSTEWSTAESRELIDCLTLFT